MSKDQLYDDYEIKTRSDLFRLIELKLRESKGIPKRLENAYDECLGLANRLRIANSKLIELPDPTLNTEQNLINLRDWCTDSRTKTQPGATEQDTIIIESWHFNKGKTWRLLEDIVGDRGRDGVECKLPRTVRSLRENLRKVGKRLDNDNYFILAKSLKHKDELARTTIKFGKIAIS